LELSIGLNQDEITKKTSVMADITMQEKHIPFPAGVKRHRIDGAKIT
jgi:hypothetical protein